MTTKTRRKARTEPIPPAELREPTEGERAAMDAAKTRFANRPSRVEIRQQPGPNGVLSIGQPHKEGGGWSRQLTDTFGTASPAFAEQVLCRLGNVIKERSASIPTEGQTNAALALMGGIAPRDELEAAIGEQIIAAHVASLDFLRRAQANAGEYRDTAVAYTNAATKLTRTMGAMVENPCQAPQRRASTYRGGLCQRSCRHRRQRPYRHRGRGRGWKRNCRSTPCNRRPRPHRGCNWPADVAPRRGRGLRASRRP